MTFSEFLTKYNGKYVDFDGYYGGQCMDIMHQYCLEVLGISNGSVLAAPSARDVYVNYSNIVGQELFEKIDNTPTGVPQEGDIMFWVNSPYGHVAIFLEGDANKFTSFDQNYPTGSPCHVQSHTYTNVGGWLRFKGQKPDQALTTCLADRLKFMDQINKELNPKIASLEQRIKDMEHDIESYKSQIQHHEDFLKQTSVTLNCEVDEAKILGNISSLVSQSDLLRQTQKKNEEQAQEITEMTLKYDNIVTEHNSSLKELSSVKESLQDVSRALETTQNELGQLKLQQKYIPTGIRLFNYIVCKEVK